MPRSRSVFDYLAKTQIQGLETRGGEFGPNTTSGNYSWKDIKGLHPWANFTFEHITRSPYAQCLTRPVVSREPPSRQMRFYDENTLYDRFGNVLFPYLRRALAASLDPCPPGHVPLTSDVGGAARQRGKGFLDRAGRIRDDGLSPEESPNRLPGEIKVSWKWQVEWASLSVTVDRGREYRQVLSQQLYYMKCHETRYGYILTDWELVCLRRRPGEPGHLDVSPPIPITACNDDSITVLPVLWYIHILASDGTEW
ncbi:hypothetical protein JAAARDRAFT_100279, partial [Jaapia argillacea MUCL 33604]